MSLDKWLGKEEDKEEEEDPEGSKEGQKKQKGSPQQTTLIPQKKKKSKAKLVETVKQKVPKGGLSHKLQKYLLTCSNSKCKYKKTLMKRELKGSDKICPRCKSDMNVKVV